MRKISRRKISLVLLITMVMSVIMPIMVMAEPDETTTWTVSFDLNGVEGVEPSPSAPKTETLPLRYTPIGYYFNPSSQGYMEWLEGFEPSLETWQASVRTINTVTTFGGEQGIFTLSTSLTK